MHGAGPVTSTPFHAYAVRSRWGPHVTLQAGVVHLGRHWTTTTRRSVKSVAVNRWAYASATVDDGDGRYRILAGPAHLLDGLRPWSLVGDPLDTVLAGGAVARLAGTNLEQIVGYAEAGRAVPSTFLPWGRVVLVTAVRDELTVDDGAVTGATTRWTGRRPASALRAERRRGAPAGWSPPVTDRPIPAAALDLASEARACLVGVETSGGPVAIPARWDPATGQVALPAAVVAAVGPRLPGPACVTFDESSDRRPDRKIGLMLRGGVTVAAVNDVAVHLGVATDRITHWSGFASGSALVSGS